VVELQTAKDRTVTGYHQKSWRARAGAQSKQTAKSLAVGDGASLGIISRDGASLDIILAERRKVTMGQRWDSDCVFWQKVTKLQRVKDRKCERAK
jgi:hypothetical protein